MNSVQIMKNGEERALYGCIVTFENAEGRLFTIHREGPPVAGFKQACAIAFARDDTYRVVSYSTPQTICADLKGRSESGRGGLALPESHLCGQTGLRSMLHPRFLVPRKMAP